MFSLSLGLDISILIYMDSWQLNFCLLVIGQFYLIYVSIQLDIGIIRSVYTETRM